MNAIENWRVELIVGGQTIVEIKFQRGIFEGDLLLPLKFIITMMPLNHILRICTGVSNIQNHRKRLITLWMI